MKRNAIRRTLWLIPLILPALLGCGGGAGGGGEPAGFWDQKKAELESTYGVDIEFDNVTFPTGWASHNPQWTRVSESGRFSILSRLETDLKRYPADFITTNLRKIFIVSTLKVDGRTFGGTNYATERWLYIDDGWLGDSGHSKAMGFHHEFSSILYRLYPDRFNDSAWLQNNPSGFEYAYRRSGSENIASGRTDVTGTPADYEKGFICEYGQLTFEDDINTYAQFLVAKFSMLNGIAASYPRVQGKTDMLLQFYFSIGYRQ